MTWTVTVRHETENINGSIRYSGTYDDGAGVIASCSMSANKDNDGNRTLFKTACDKAVADAAACKTKCDIIASAVQTLLNS